MINLSFWEQQSFFHHYDVVVIGSGIVGLTAALHLRKNNKALKIAVVERGVLPLGGSTRNAGFACIGSMSELLDDLQSRPADEVFALVERRWKGLLRLRQILSDKQLQYQPLGGFEIFKPEETAVFEKCMTHIEQFNRELAAITGEREVYSFASHKVSGFGFKNVAHIIFNKAEGQLHTGEMMKGLLALARREEIPIFNGIAIERIEEEQAGGVGLYTDQDWHFTARQVLVATNGFARRLLPDLALFAGRSQVLITKPLHHLPFRGSFHYDKGFYYFRDVDEPGRPGWSRILLGGGRNLDLEAEKTDQFGTTEIITNALSSLVKNVIAPTFPVEIESWWSGILGVGMVKKPIIEMVSPQVGVAVRLGGMGVAIGSLVGEEAAQMLLEAA